MSLLTNKTISCQSNSLNTGEMKFTAVKLNFVTPITKSQLYDLIKTLENMNLKFEIEF
jgi:hypothetical protein